MLTGYRESKLPSLLRAMQELQAQVGFHISAELFAEVLKASGEGND